jgi:hypothetical protein
MESPGVPLCQLEDFEICPVVDFLEPLAPREIGSLLREVVGEVIRPSSSLRRASSRPIPKYS